MSDAISLTPVFLAHCTSDPAPAGTVSEEELRAAWEQGHSRWPDVPLLPEAFVRHLAQRLAAQGEVGTAALSGLNLPDLYLACAAALGEPHAIAALDRTVLTQVPLYLAALRLPEAVIDDVRQEVRVRLLLAPPGVAPRIAEYGGRGALSSFVRVAAVRVALNLRRGKAAQAQAPDTEMAERAVSAAPDPELQYLKDRYQKEFREALLAAIASLSGEEHSLLYMYFAGGLNTPQIAALLQVSRPTVSRMLSSARERMAEQVRRHLRERLRVSDAELQSLYRVVQSQLDLSIRQLLPPPPDA